MAENLVVGGIMPPQSSGGHWKDETEMFHKRGFLVVPDLLDVDKVESMYQHGMDNFQRLQDHIAKENLPLGIGIKEGYAEVVQRHPHRFEMPFMMEHPAFDYIALHPDILQLVRSILGDDIRVANRSLVVSLPGADDQSWHSDGPHMSTIKDLPCHCLNVFVPLVDVDDTNGPTSFRPESHTYTRDLTKLYMKAFMKKQLRPIESPNLTRGSVLLFDYRVLHRGLANKSDRPRPILVITFAKSWYQDVLNFPKRSVLTDTSASAADPASATPSSADASSTINSSGNSSSSSSSSSSSGNNDSSSGSKTNSNSSNNENGESSSCSSNSDGSNKDSSGNNNNVGSSSSSSSGSVQSSAQCGLPACQSVSNLQRCARCKGVFYCCADHQRTHWDEHKRTCRPPAKQPQKLPAPRAAPTESSPPVDGLNPPTSSSSSSSGGAGGSSAASASSGEKRCTRCMFCGEQIEVGSEDEAVRHLEQCSALQEQLDSQEQFTIPSMLRETKGGVM